MAEAQTRKPVEKIQQAQQAAQDAAKAKTTSQPTRHQRSRLFLVAVISAAAAFGFLTLLVKSAPTLPLDLKITHALQSITWPPFAFLMSAVSWPGFSPQSFIIPIVIVLLIYSFGLRWEAVASLVAALFPVLVNGVVKAIVQRPRPTIDLVQVFAVLKSYSFPSGHVMFYLGFFGFLFYLAYTLLKHSLLRTSLMVFFGALILLVGASRIYLGEHWPSDVLGAYLLGSLTLIANIFFYRWGKTRFFVSQPVAPEKPATKETAS